jgi:predicted ATPase
VVTETCRLSNGEWFSVNRGEVKSSLPSKPPASPNRLFLVNASGFPAFRPVYDAILSIAVYSPVPDSIRTVDESERLTSRNGAGLARLVLHMEKRQPDALKRVEEYLSRILPGFRTVRTRELGGYRVLEFDQDWGQKNGKSFPARNISDGTLRSLAILVALFFEPYPDQYSTLIGIEEPEAGLHPAATGTLLDAIREASQLKQVVITTHSPDLLEAVDLTRDTLLAVVTEAGETQIGPVDAASREAIQRHLYSAGDLLRMNQLEVEVAK